MVISNFPWEIVMLEKYFIRPTTVVQISGETLSPPM